MVKTGSGATAAPAVAGEPAVAPIDAAVLARARVGLGRALWRLGKPAEAATLFAQFLASSGGDPEAPAVGLERAGALAAAGSTDDALAAYAQVIAHSPQTREALQADLREPGSWPGAENRRMPRGSLGACSPLRRSKRV